jgi:outer membrane lipoprotein-sorting protein
MPAMASTPARWDQASAAPVAADGRRTPEIVQLGPDTPDLATLFAFARDAELRFATLRLRLEERVAIAGGETLRVHEVLLRHPGRARVTTIRPDLPTPTNHEIWLGDGETVRIYRSGHRLATSRPVRTAPAGIDGRDLPGPSRPYLPLTALPPNTLADAFIHPGGYCQNVLATGACSVAGTGIVTGREAVFVTADHPRTVEIAGDRPDHRIEVAVDRETGVLLLLVESFGGVVTRHAEATELTPDAAIPDSAFSMAVPADASMIY